MDLFNFACPSFELVDGILLGVCHKILDRELLKMMSNLLPKFAGLNILLNIYSA